MKNGFLFLFLYFPLFIVAQNDTLWVKNGNVLFGEIKVMNSGVLTMETPYSDSDFTIDFDEVERLSVERRCIVQLNGGTRILGYIRSDAPGELTLRKDDGSKQVFRLDEVTGFMEVKDLFWKRFKGNIDLGFNLTKANNNRQLTVTGGLSYRGIKWLGDLGFSTLRSERDDVEKVERNSANLSVIRLISDKWYFLGSAGFLSNTEQQLDGRVGLRTGPGRYLALNDKLLWGITGGLNYNIENFAGEALDKESTELFLSTNFEMFDFRDFSLNTRLDLFPSLSESGRLRIDYNLDLKYDLPWDFYIKTGFQFNYDNQAVEAGRQFDYVLASGVGWSF